MPPFRQQDFEPTPSLERFAALPFLHRLDLFAPAMSPAPGPLLFSGAARAGPAREHAWRRLLPAVSFYALPGYTLAGAGALRGPQGEAFACEDCIAEPAPFPAAAAAPLELPAPIAVAFQPEAGYGRFLVETLPRLYLLAMLRRLGLPLPVAAPADLPDWIGRLLALYVPPDALVRYDPAHQALRAPVVVVPGMMNVDHALHPAMNLMVEDLLIRAGAAAPAEAAGTRLYLSYRSWQGGRFSRLDNAAEVEAALERLGFRTLQPWRMSLAEQLAAYAGAACIVSEPGSAATNALFARRGAAVAVFGAPDRLLSRITALRGQRLGVIEPVEGPDPPDRFRIDPAGLERFLPHLLAAAAPSPPPPAAVAAPASGTTHLPVGPALAELAAQGGVVRTALFAEAETLPRLPFFHGEPIDAAVAPFAGLFTDPAYRSYTAPRIACAALTGASVIGVSGLITLGGRLLRESMHAIDTWRSESTVASLDPEHGARLKHPLALPGTPLPGVWFSAITGPWRNYAHWLTEVLPRLYLFRLLRGALPEARLLVPDFARHPAYARALQLLGLVGDSVRPLADDAVVAPQTLWVAPNIDVWCPPALCRIAAQALAAAVPPASAPAAGERLYLSREGSIRHVVNLPELVPLLRQHGFAVLRMETLTLDAQIHAMQQARYVIAEQGAAVCNIMFCRPGTRVLELFNAAGAQPAHWVLSSLCGLDYGYLVGRHVPAAHAPEPGGNADYAIAPEQLAAGVAALLA